MLDVNHRNTAEVLEFAKAMVASDSFVDIEGVDGAGDAVSAVTRSGPAPVVVRSRTRAEHDEAMVARVRSVLQLVGVGRGDVGILVGSNREESLVSAVLSAAGIPSVSLQKYDGRTVDAAEGRDDQAGEGARVQAGVARERAGAVAR